MKVLKQCNEKEDENIMEEGKNSSEKEKISPLWKDVLALVFKIVGIMFLFILAFTFVFGLNRNQDGDMYPAVKDGDLVVFYRLDKNYKAGDCLVLEYEGKKQVRRVMAIAGDTVDITADGLLINGILQVEKGIYEETLPYENETNFPITLEQGQIFVLGDARKNATDSRVYGAVNYDKTLGKVMLICRRREF